MNEATPQIQPVNDMESTRKILHMSRNFLYEQINDGKLKTYTVGTRRYCSDKAIYQFIKDREAEA